LAHLFFVLVVVVASLAAPADSNADDKGEIWAVLVAGSNTYDNYRHQVVILEPTLVKKD
jgi:glycosylphosphatidylinositol transamidase (GPIT) subunit GPI8